MARHFRKVATAAAVASLVAVSGCGLSFDVDPMTGSPRAAETAGPTASPKPTPSAVPSDRPYDPNDPTTWTDRQLVAQTVFVCTPVANVGGAHSSVAKGIGGVVFLGRGAPGDLKRQIASLVKKSRGEVAPFIASDEEGGSVQRLEDVIYALPSARVMGTWDASRITTTAKKYGKNMKRLGVDLSFSPVADLNIEGQLIAMQSRAFSDDPQRAGDAAVAWATGLDSSGVAPVIKHWPGHGRASDTHLTSGRIPSLAQLVKSDLKPFSQAIRAGFTAVMVGHLESKGLTERGVPASRSPRALAVLRDEIGPDGLIITDSLTMEGALVGVRHRLVDALYKTLDAGADIAVICTDPTQIVKRVASKLSTTDLTRAELIEKVSRILAWKKRFGVID
jgi:beta-N-acetylhexosaminidase